MFEFVARLDCDFHAGLPAEVGTYLYITDGTYFGGKGVNLGIAGYESQTECRTLRCACVKFFSSIARTSPASGNVNRMALPGSGVCVAVFVTMSAPVFAP